MKIVPSLASCLTHYKYFIITEREFSKFLQQTMKEHRFAAINAMTPIPANLGEGLIMKQERH